MRKAMGMIGSKWKMLIIQNMRNGKKRYGELKRLIPDISEKMLIQELKLLVEAELVSKTIYHEIPPKVEYELTDRGRLVLPILDSIAQFAANL